MSIAMAAGLMNLILGAVYLQYGTMTIIEMKRGWRTLGFTHFGAAWIALAFTCGPHHLVHGALAVAGAQYAGPLDLIAVAIGFPAGVIWFLLRIEAFRGGSGDRFISGTPLWLMAVPVFAGAYVTALAAAAMNSGETLHWSWVLVPNLGLIVVYLAIGYFLTRTQLGNRPGLGGWSTSGVALALVFPTCAAMHAVYAYYAMTGAYGWSPSVFTIDWLGVPAGIYFLWVVHGLYREALADWNQAPAPAATPLETAASTAPYAEATT
jgi:hypothetical protein